MQWGICTPVENAALVKAAGWDFLEENVQSLLQGDKPDGQWTGRARVQAAGLTSVPAANCLVPASLKIVGPEASLDKLAPYMANVCRRAEQVGMKILVFGSAGARMVPAGWERAAAREQILAFLRMSAPLAQRHGITLVVEHLNQPECNIINSIAEAMEYVRTLNHPHVQCLADSWHFWLMKEPLDSLAAALPWIKHVHLADTEGRVAPGQSGKCDYRPFFAVLKRGGYDARISVECKFVPSLEATVKDVLAYVKQQWAQA